MTRNLTCRSQLYLLPPRFRRAPSVSIRRVVTLPRAPRHIIRIFSTEENNDGDQKTEDTSTETEFAEQLKQQGVEKENAQRILQFWKDAGAENPEQLRKLFLRGSLRPLGIILLQLILDAGATYGSFVFASAISLTPGIPLPFIFSTLGTFAGFYFLTSTAFDIVTFFTLLWSIYRFGTNTEAFLAALESIAGTSNNTVVGKAKKIVDAFKVIQALNKISDVLQEKGAGEISSLESLSGYLTLSYAETNYGFEPEKYGLTVNEATNIAVVFSRYDENDDGVLEVTEISSMLKDLGTPLDDEELRAAMKVLDIDNSGVIELEEFVNWWVNKVKPDRAKVIEEE